MAIAPMMNILDESIGCDETLEERSHYYINA